MPGKLVGKESHGGKLVTEKKIKSSSLLKRQYTLLNFENILFVYTFDKTPKMKNLSLKMDDRIFKETEKITAQISKNRNRYINEAVEFYNLLQKRKIISRRLEKESKMIREESMKVLAEFEKFRDED